MPFMRAPNCATGPLGEKIHPNRPSPPAQPTGGIAPQRHVIIARYADILTLARVDVRRRLPGHGRAAGADATRRLSRRPAQGALYRGMELASKGGARRRRTLRAHRC